MNKPLFRCLCRVLAGSMALVALSTPAADNPHAISRRHDSAICATCHNSVPQLSDDKILSTKNLPVDWSAFKQDGVSMCASCHNRDAYHKVPVGVDFPVPADLPLNEDKEMICLTCHYAHGRLDSDRPQASFSFMDRMLNAERLRKSFLLRRNNSNGELCLTCHNLDEGSK